MPSEINDIRIMMCKLIIFIWII